MLDCVVNSYLTHITSNHVPKSEIFGLVFAIRRALRVDAASLAELSSLRLFRSVPS